MSAKIIPFPRERAAPKTNLADEALERLIGKIRDNVLRNGGSWDEEKNAPYIRRLADILAEAVPVRGSTPR